MSLETILFRGKQLYCPKYDRVFKALLLGGDGDYTLLSSFLTNILSTEIRPESIISATSMELPTQHGEDKIVRLDLLVELADKSAVNIELQVGKDLSMGARSLYQLSRMTATAINKGGDPEDIYPRIAINVLDYDFISRGDGYHNRYRMKNVVTGAEMPGAEIFEIHFVELTKFPKNAGNSMKELWIKFLTAKTEEDLDMLTKESPIMASAVDRLVYASGTKELRKQMDDYARNEMKNRLTRAADKKEGQLEGEAIGEARGEAKKALQIAKASKEHGFPNAVIAEITGLTLKQIEEL
jgi:predicted transposase/invertase (TIGR01784 family)